MTKPGQFPLPLSHPPRYGREDYLVGEANQVAMEWIDRWPDWPGPVTCLVGPSGAGKTHLMTIWQRQSQALALDIDVLEPTQIGELAEAATSFTLDDAERLIGSAAAEEGLFHLFNRLRADGGHLLLTSSQGPARWDIQLPDLASRLKTVPLIQLAPPDDIMMAALLVKQFSDRQLDLPGAVIDYMLKRMERSYAAVQALVAALDQQALAKQRAITIPMVREVMDQLDAASDRSEEDI
ncbi:MAG: DNA replication protein [Alphaproteobacteria bacterium]|nr:DNA replication protein [Alphaproteobacteria bacterium SS10]